MNWKEYLMKSMNEQLYNYLFYYYLHLKKGYVPKVLNLRHPKTFNEKIIWLKVNQRYPNAHVMTDKVLAKDFVKQKIGAKYIIPTLAVFDEVSQIDIDKLPSSFVLKANHGSAWNIICGNKADFDFTVVSKKLNKWLKTNYYDIGKEYQYREIVPKVICEEYLGSTSEQPLIDYKIFCFNGRPTYIQVDLDRFTNHTRNFYDVDWKLVPFTTLYPIGHGCTPKPESLDEMLFIAEELSESLIFARIDLYSHEKSIYFGEITLHHGGGFEPFIPPEYDGILGDLLII